MRSKIWRSRWVVEVDGLADGPEERRWRRAACTGAGITSVAISCGTCRAYPLLRFDSWTSEGRARVNVMPARSFRVGSLSVRPMSCNPDGCDDCIRCAGPNGTSSDLPYQAAAAPGMTTLRASRREPPERVMRRPPVGRPVTRPPLAAVGQRFTWSARRHLIHRWRDVRLDRRGHRVPTLRRSLILGRRRILLPCRRRILLLRRRRILLLGRRRILLRRRRRILLLGRRRILLRRRRRILLPRRRRILLPRRRRILLPRRRRILLPRRRRILSLAGAGSFSLAGAGSFSLAGAGSFSLTGAGSFSLTGAGSFSLTGAGSFAGP